MRPRRRLELAVWSLSNPTISDTVLFAQSLAKKRGSSLLALSTDLFPLMPFLLPFIPPLSSLLKHTFGLLSSQK